MAASLPVHARTSSGGDAARSMSPNPPPFGERIQWPAAALRAMAIWPRLDRRALARCGSDTKRIAAYVARRTRMPERAIQSLLTVEE